MLKISELSDLNWAPIKEFIKKKKKYLKIAYRNNSLSSLYLIS